MPVYKDYVHCYILSCNEILTRLHAFGAELEEDKAPLYAQGENQGIIAMMNRMVNVFEEVLKRPDATSGTAVTHPKNMACLVINGVLATAATLLDERSFSKIIEDIESMARIKQNLLKEKFNQESPMLPLAEADYLKGIRSGIQCAINDILPHLATNYAARFDPSRNPYWEEARNAQPLMTSYLA